MLGYLLLTLFRRSEKCSNFVQELSFWGQSKIYGTILDQVCIGDRAGDHKPGKNSPKNRFSMLKRNWWEIWPQKWFVGMVHTDMKRWFKTRKWVEDGPGGPSMLKNPVIYYMSPKLIIFTLLLNRRWNTKRRPNTAARSTLLRFHWNIELLCLNVFSYTMYYSIVLWSGWITYSSSATISPRTMSSTLRSIGRTFWIYLCSKYTRIPRDPVYVENLIFDIVVWA